MQCHIFTYLIISGFSVLAGYFLCRYLMRRYMRRLVKQQQQEVLDLMTKFKEDLIYELNHGGIKPISASSQGLVDIIMWGLSHYIDLLTKLPEKQGSQIHTITQGLLDIRNQELVMLYTKMKELRVAIDKMLDMNNPDAK